MKTTFIIFLVSCTYGTLSTTEDQNVTSSPQPCDSEIYCYGDLLHYVQILELYEDSKTYVDMKLKFSPDVTISDFKYKIENEWKSPPKKNQLFNFIQEYFEKENNELEVWIPSDFNENPKFVGSIKDLYLKKWALDINKIWKTLGRKINDKVRLHPELYSMIYVPNPVIIPGGRFREIYYWDSYWIIRGLLICEMQSTAKGMIKNYLSMVETFGLVPNGGRIYYARRSQPPMLTPMMKSYLDFTGDTEFVKENIHILEKEFIYWMTNHTKSIEKNGKTYLLGVYGDSSKGPRPESYREDIIKGDKIQSENDKEEFYSELKAAAESGWDFSSRWFVLNGTNQGDITNVKTRSIIPVDLNALLYWGAKILGDFYRDMNVSDKAQKYEIIADQWRDAVTAVLWDEEVGVWLDFDVVNKIKRNYFYPTNISPLWTGCYDHNNTDYFVSRILKYLNKREIMDNSAGIPTTLMTSNEQWDQPNAWPPLQYITVMSLDSPSHLYAKTMASEFAERWICTNFLAYNSTGKMYEKYQVNTTGQMGESTGEYPLQDGFGWTNGIILELLSKYNSINLTTTCIDKLTPADRCRLKIDNC